MLYTSTVEPYCGLPAVTLYDNFTSTGLLVPTGSFIQRLTPIVWHRRSVSAAYKQVLVFLLILQAIDIMTSVSMPVVQCAYRGEMQTYFVDGVVSGGWIRLCFRTCEFPPPSIPILAWSLRLNDVVIVPSRSTTHSWSCQTATHTRKEWWATQRLRAIDIIPDNAVLYMRPTRFIIVYIWKRCYVRTHG